jgi:polyphosphate kinase
VRAPRSLPRIIRLPKTRTGEATSSRLRVPARVLSAFVDELFPGMEVKGAYQFRVTRNSELIVDEDEVENLALALRDELLGRGYLRAVRLEIDERCPQDRSSTACCQLRAARERGLPHQRPGQPQPGGPGLRPGAAPGPEIPPFQPRSRARSMPCST